MSAIEFEAARVAAALGIEKWDAQKEGEKGYSFERSENGLYFECGINSSGHWFFVRTADDAPDKNEFTEECFNREAMAGICFGEWEVTAFKKHRERLSSTLYKLGCNIEKILSKLPTLTHHEQIEARLSMPREFWPQAWIDEQKART